jgi:preprotein translocase subunit SecD
MEKYPLWKYAIIVVAVLAAIIYTIPNLYGQIPAVQISDVNSNDIDSNLIEQIKINLNSHDIVPIGVVADNKTIKFKFDDVDTQLKAQSVIQNQIGSSYIVALNLMSASPEWLNVIHANPMFLGLDLRGGVHFLLEVDTKAAVKKMLDKYTMDIKRDLLDNQIRYGQITVSDNQILIQFRDADAATNALNQINKDLPKIKITADGQQLMVTLTQADIDQIKSAAIKQNILILHNRVNELGVSEPIIQQQGRDRIMVELPGVQDTARAKDILGRTATLDLNMVDDDNNDISQAINNMPPPGTQLLNDSSSGRGNGKILIYNDVELTGDNIVDAQPGFDETGNPAVNIRLDDAGSAIFKRLTGDNIGKRMAMVLVDNGKSQVVTAPVIRTQIGGGQVQISGAMNVAQANDVALLLRSGALAAPMNIIEERTIGPSLGKENINKGFHSVLWGMVAIAIFIIIYYLVFGVVSIISLLTNLMLLIAILSMLQATLTLPGIAAIALTLGMAIDSNVLINERIREEIRLGRKPHLAIHNGYSHALSTILDSNVTTLIAGLALLAFGTGPIKGFAIVHCLGIITSLFSAVFVSKGIVGLIYFKNRINKLHI